MLGADRGVFLRNTFGSGGVNSLYLKDSSYNRFEGNFVVGVEDGDGFWVNGMHNSFRGNVVARAGTGFYFPPNLDASQVFEVPTADGHTETLSLSSARCPGAPSFGHLVAARVRATLGPRTKG